MDKVVSDNIGLMGKTEITRALQVLARSLGFTLGEMRPCQKISNQEET